MTIKSKEDELKNVFLVDKDKKIISIHSNSIKLWDINTGECLKIYSLEENDTVTSSAYSEEKY